MNKRLFAVVASLLVAVGIGMGGAPAYAANNAVCDARIDVAGYGGVTVCYNHLDPQVYTTVTLQKAVEPGGFYVILHDWTYDGHAIYVEYQPWGSSAWHTIVTDIEGGTVAQSVMIEDQETKLGIPIRYMRVRTEGSGAFSYIFKPTSGAGSGNGCGLRGVNGCTY
jgi:hypothetical protein